MNTSQSANYYSFWDFGDGNFSSLKDPYHTYSTNGNFTVCLIITDTVLLCSDTICNNITITNANSPCTLNSSYSYILNANGNVAFTNSSTGNISSYFWDFDDGNTSTLVNPNHQYTNNGDYKVCLTITNNINNCTDMFCDTVSVINAANINCNYTPSADTVQNTMTYEFTCITNGTNYFWDFGDGNTSNLINPTHTYLNPGAYTYCLTVDNCPMVCNNIYVIDCYSNFTHFPDSFNNSIINVINNAQGSPINYFWDFGDGNTSTMAYPQHTYTNSGTYYVCLTVDDGGNCIDTYCDSISGGQIIKQNGFSINVFPNNINEVKSNLSNLNVFPNPSSNYLNIELYLNSRDNYNIFITDLYGRIIKTIDASNLNKGNNIVKCSLQNIPLGLYLLNIKSSTEYFTEKIIVH